MAASDKDSQLGLSREFAVSLGLFYINWAKVELTVDFAIGKFLKIVPNQTHLITASIDFGRRAQWLRALINESDMAHKTRAVTALNAIQNDSKRNAFAHSYISNANEKVIFVERVPFGKFMIKAHTFDWASFKAHVDDIADHAISLQGALGASEDDLNGFAQAAINMAAKVTVSPVPPNEIA